MGLKMWMRKIRVTLTSTISGMHNYRLIFGDVDTVDGYGKKVSFQNGIPLYEKDLSINKTHNIPTIRISGKKFLSSTKDSGVVTIFNMDQETMLKIINYKMFDIKVEIGYKNGNFFTLFEGGVSYVSQKTHSRHDIECYLCYASKLVASYSQARINFSVMPGMTAYQALNILTVQQGIAGGILNDLKNIQYDETYNDYGSITYMIDKLTTRASISDTLGGNINFGTDCSDGNIVSFFSQNNKRNIILGTADLPLINGNPKIDSNGLSLTVIPNYLFKAGDIITIDNSLIDASLQSNVQSTFTATYIDNGNYINDIANGTTQESKKIKSSLSSKGIKNPGSYMVYEIEYNMENRGKNFNYKVKARAISLITNLTE